jgi:hypothetical protein
MSFISNYFIFTLFLTTHLNAKLLIFTYSFNRPDFIEIQKKTFDKFLSEEYDFMVFNDAKDNILASKIAKTCQKLNIACVRIPQEIHLMPRPNGQVLNAPSTRHCQAIKYSLDYYGFRHEDLLMIIDSDCFLVKQFKVREYMQGCQIAGIKQSRMSPENKLLEYISPILVFMDFTNMPNKNTIDFSCGLINKTQLDSGGYMYYYLQQNPNIKIKDLNLLYPNDFACKSCPTKCLHYTEDLKRLNMDQPTINFIQAKPLNCEFILDTHFLHYRAGSNWNKKDTQYHNHKTKLFKEYLNKIMLL